jgi:glutathionylspermidine amidase/synthetase
MGNSASKFGTVIGVAPGGVEAFSSDYKTAWRLPTAANFRHHHRGVYTGMRFQCVEFARRYLVHTRGVTFGGVGMAYEIMDLPHFTRVDFGAPAGRGGDAAAGVGCPVVKTRNGAAGGARPVLGSVILWHPTGYYRRTGHVAIVTAATDAYIRVAEQNITDAPWPAGADWARQLPVVLGNNGEYRVVDPHRNSSVLGWVTVPES